MIIGGLHISMNFMHVSGKNMFGSGCLKFRHRNARRSFYCKNAGKACAKAVRAHKLTLQAIWHPHPLSPKSGIIWERPKIDWIPFVTNNRLVVNEIIKHKILTDFV